MKNSIVLLLAVSIHVISGHYDEASKEPLLVDPPVFDPALKPDYRLLLGGGSTNPKSTTQEMMLQPTMPMFDILTQRIVKEVKKGLQYVFQTKSPYVAAISGTGRKAMEAAIDNMVERNDKVLVPCQGFWSQRARKLFQRLGADVHTIEAIPGNTFNLSDILTAIKDVKPKVVFVVGGNSFAGTQQEINGIGELCAEMNCYVIADVVAMVGIQPVYFDEWKLDVAFCNTQKGIGSVAGLAGIAYSERAVERVKSRKTKPISVDHDLNGWIQDNFWFMSEVTNKAYLAPYAFLPVLYYPLREALREISEEGLPKIWARHKTVHDYLINKFTTELPQLEYFVKIEEDRLIGTFLMKPPIPFTAKQVINYLFDKFSIRICNGEGSEALEETLKFAVFGPNAQKKVVDKLFDALNHGVNASFGQEVKPDGTATTFDPFD